MIRQENRGQATVEAALGVIVLSSVLIFAIHFGEIGFISLKVQEAAAASLWNATGNGQIPGGAGDIHHWPDNHPQPFDQSVPLVAATTAEVVGRYQDFDGRTSAVGGMVNSQFYTNASNMNIQCAMNTPPAFGPGVAFGSWAGSLMVGNVYQDNGGVTCNAQATVNASPLMPSFMMEGGSGFFHTSLGLGAANNMKVCGFGRAWGGSCQAKYTMSIDDWGSENQDESGLCLIAPLNPFVATGCSLPTANRNTRLHEASKRMFNSASSFALAFAPLTSTLATTIVGWSPISTTFPAQNEGDFFLSASGEEVLFLQPSLPGLFPPEFIHYRIAGYGTTPGGPPPISYVATYFGSWTLRTGCFLGRSCT